MLSSFQNLGGNVVHVTEYNSSTHFISGNFSGHFSTFYYGLDSSGAVQSDTSVYNISGSFRVRF